MGSIKLLLHHILITLTNYKNSRYSISNTVSEMKQSDWSTWYKSVVYFGLVSNVIYTPLACSHQYVIMYLTQP